MTALTLIISAISSEKAMLSSYTLQCKDIHSRCNKVMRMFVKSTTSTLTWIESQNRDTFWKFVLISVDSASDSVLRTKISRLSTMDKAVLRVHHKWPQSNTGKLH